MTKISHDLNSEELSVFLHDFHVMNGTVRVIQVDFQQLVRRKGADNGWFLKLAMWVAEGHFDGCLGSPVPGARAFRLGCPRQVQSRRGWALFALLVGGAVPWLATVIAAFSAAQTLQSAMSLLAIKSK